MERGKIYLIEGTDGSGKNRQAKKLVDRLNEEGIKSQMMSFPRYDLTTGRIIAECYLGRDGKKPWFPDPTKVPPKIASQLYAMNRLEAKPEIESIINSGTNLILDRYVESNMAHQGGKLHGEDRKNFIDFVGILEYGLLKLPKPDKTIFLYVPAEIAFELRKKRNEIPDAHESNFEHLKNAEETYLWLSEEFNWTKIECAPNGTMRNREGIAEEVYEILGF